MTLRIAVSLLFVWAARHKLRDVAGFRAALASYELLPRRWAGSCAGLLIAIESGVAIGLWLPGLVAVAGLTAAGLLALYAGAIAINLVRGRRDIDCGCSGIARDRPLSGALVVRNGMLLIAALLLTLPSTLRLLSWLDAFTIIAGTAALALLYAAADGLLANAPRSAALAEDHVAHPNKKEWKTGNRKPEMENRQVDRFPVSGFLFAVFHFFSVLLSTLPVRD